MTNVINSSENSAIRTEGMLSMMDILIVVARRKRLIAVTTMSAAVLMTAVSFALPNIYKSSTRLLPPQQAQSSASALLSQLGGLAGDLGGGKSSTDLYVSMLKSRTIADRLIERFDLEKQFQTDSQEIARLALEKNTQVTAGKDGLITIEVESKDRKQAAPLANAYVDELIKLTRVLAVTEAAKRRLFFQQQLESAKNGLAAAEIALKSGIDAKGLVSVDSESGAIVETLGRLRAQASAKEIELDSMRAFVTANNPDFVRVQEELLSLRRELARLENGGRNKRNDDEGSTSGTRAGLENIKLLRDVKYHQMLYELLAKQYEVARIDEAKNSSVIQVLDTAIEPEGKSKPNRLLLIISGVFGGGFAAILWSLLTEGLKRARAKPARAAQLEELQSELKSR